MSKFFVTVVFEVARPENAQPTSYDKWIANTLRKWATGMTDEVKAVFNVSSVCLVRSERSNNTER